MEQEELCDFCGLPADALGEECWRVDCRAHCSSSGAGDVYHGDCMVTYLKGLGLPGVRHLDAKTAKRIPRWPCPKGKGKGPGQLCKSWVEGGATSVVTRKAKTPKPPSAPAPAAAPRNKQLPAAGSSSKANPQANPPRQPAAKAPNHANNHHQQQQPAIVRRPAVEQAPKPDPLGRKLVGSSKAGEPQQAERALPPGYDPDAAVINKNARKRAKAAAAAAAAGGGGAQQQLQQLGPSSSTEEGGLSGGASTCSGPSGFGEGGGFRPAIAEQHRVLMGGGKFISNPEDFAKLLGGMGLLSDEEEDEADHHLGEEQADTFSMQPPAVGQSIGSQGRFEPGHQQQQQHSSVSINLPQVGGAAAAHSTGGGLVVAEAVSVSPLTSAVSGPLAHLLGTQQQQQQPLPGSVAGATVLLVGANHANGGTQQHQQALPGSVAVQLPAAAAATAAAAGPGLLPYHLGSVAAGGPHQPVVHGCNQPAAAYLPFLQLQQPAHGAAVLHHSMPKGPTAEAAVGAADVCGVSASQVDGVSGAGGLGAAAPAGGEDEDEDAALVEELMLVLT